MKSPLAGRELLVLDSVGSSQDAAAQLLRESDNVGAVLARDQIAGRGRFNREWISAPGDSLTVSLMFRDYADHPRPHLVGMAVAAAVAGAVHCHLRWPNDLVEWDRKLGGILTELQLDGAGRRVPIVGIGLNLNQGSFPEEIAETATSLCIVHGRAHEADAVLADILSRIELMPEPNAWGDIAPVWTLFDVTPGKRYRLPSGDEGVAIGIGGEGQLLCSVRGESTAVLAADALFGPSTSII